MNGRIRAREVRLIDSDGQQLGVKPLREALALAQQRGMDLVEIAPNATPPVCKVLEYGKYRYEQAKREKESRKAVTSSKTKQIKFHVSISEHDFQIKLRQIAGFLEKHMRCKVSLFFRGREMAHQDLGQQVMKRLAKEVGAYGTVEMEPKLMGRSINMLISPLSGKKAKPHGPEAAPPAPPKEPHHGGRVMAVEVHHTPAPMPASGRDGQEEANGRPAPPSGARLNPLGAAFERVQPNKAS
ncbi:MAG: translation initiation factor IF-3 [Verrucomicrobia bacterium]|nr:translation initiation factor IF-3 [Verrucomicrobiota bacterium]